MHQKHMKVLFWDSMAKRNSKVRASLILHEKNKANNNQIKFQINAKFQLCLNVQRKTEM